MLRIIPHVAIFAMGGILATFSLLLVIYLRHRGSTVLLRLPAYVFAVVAWFCYYVVSVGPIVALDEHVIGLDLDSLQVIYAPVIWLHDATFLREPLEQYAELWRWS